MQTLPKSRSCFVCGTANPVGFRLDMHADGRLVHAHFQFRTEHVGFRETVHGGLVGTILDELMVWACGVAAGQFAYSAEITVRYRHPVRPLIPIIGEAELAENRRNRLYIARGSLREADGGRLLAESTGKYIPVPHELSDEFRRDFIEDPAAILAAARERHPSS